MIQGVGGWGGTGYQGRVIKTGYLSSYIDTISILHAHVGLVTSSFYFCTKGPTAHSLHSIRLFFSLSLGLTIQYNTSLEIVD